MSKDMKDNFRNNFRNQNNTSNVEPNIKSQGDELIDNTDTIEQNQTPKFRIGKKLESKSDIKSFPLRMDSSKNDKIDKIVTKTKYSKNEVINMMIDFCLENLEYDFK